MTQSDHDKMLQRVRALLAKAEDRAATEEESKAYTAKAAQLMAKYSIDQAMIDALRNTELREKPGDRIVVVQAPYAFAKIWLIGAIARNSRVKLLIRHRAYGASGAREVHLFGFPSDLERTEMLFTSLLLQVARLRRITQAPAWLEPGQKRAYAREWLYGFATEIGSRLRAAEEYAMAQARTEQPPDSPSTDLVLIGRDELVKDLFEQFYPQTTQIRSSVGNGRGYQDGRDAGKRVDLGGTRLAGNRRAIG